MRTDVCFHLQMLFKGWESLPRPLLIHLITFKADPKRVTVPSNRRGGGRNFMFYLFVNWREII